ncbi:MAG: L,D-transpeptidase [Synechococcaceae cyanobacterium]|jgi:lipoprotein-anchoring transpeptidase ErfK/SrfK
MTRHPLTGLLIPGLLLPVLLPGLAAAPAARAAELPPLPALTSTAPAPARPSSAAATPAGAPGAATTAAATSNRQILLELGRRTISLLEDGKVLASWPVAIGDSATPTPTGTFTVRNKVINPQYQSTKSGKVNPTVGPQGPLGDRWIGFHATDKDQFGIHGTPSAWAWTVTSRAAVTHGCVRMLTPHVRQLFEKVDLGTPVIVRR